ncbi:hypothetical protein AAK894_04350 [Lachnospiraceae bacterium 46-61]
MIDNYKAKRFKNGNINIRFSPDYIALIKSDKASDVEVLSWILEDIDCYFIGESYCTSNYTSGATVYDSYNDNVFRLEFGGIDDLTQGKAMKLYALVPDDIDREILAEEGY